MFAGARAGDDPAAFDRGLAEGQAWDIDSAVAEGLANPAGPRIARALWAVADRGR